MGNQSQKIFYWTPDKHSSKLMLNKQAILYYLLQSIFLMSTFLAVIIPIAFDTNYIQFIKFLSI